MWLRWIFAAWLALPERSKADALEFVLDRTWRRIRKMRDDEIVACANYIEEAADQYARAGKEEIAEALHATARALVRQRTQAADDEVGTAGAGEIGRKGANA